MKTCRTKQPGPTDRAMKRNFFERHRFLIGLLFALITLVVIGIVAEIALRVMGYEPLDTPYQLVDELEIYHQFYTDETGILKLNHTYYEQRPGYSINRDGFRDAEIEEQLQTDRPTIMFVGDSFTQGLSAEPITNCFANLIESHGYTAFNFGVGATDPVQYAAVAAHYVPIVKPDMIAVMVYLGNDVNRYPQKVVPHKQIQYGTNAGVIYAFDANGNHMTAEEAYEYYYGGLLKKVEYYARKSMVACLVGRSLVGLRHKRLMKQHRASSGGEETDPNQYVIDSLARIKQVADEHGVRCVCFLIPARPDLRHKLNRLDDVRYVFGGIDYVHAEFGAEDYHSGGDAHFNNAGHKKMTEVIRDVFEEPDSPLISKD